MHIYGIKFLEDLEKSTTNWSKKFITWLGKIKFETTIGVNVMKNLINDLNWLEEEI